MALNGPAVKKAYVIPKSKLSLVFRNQCLRPSSVEKVPLTFTCLKHEFAIFNNEYQIRCLVLILKIPIKNVAFGKRIKLYVVKFLKSIF